MAALSTVVAIGALVVGAYAAYEGHQARKEQRNAQEKMASEQNAGNKAQAAQEARRQIREERVRRARIMQAGQNTGTADSSGEFGSIGSLETGLSSNLGFNLGANARATQMSIFAQDNANAQMNERNAGDLFNLSTSIFSASGGFSNFNGSSTGGSQYNYRGTDLPYSLRGGA